MNRSDSGVYGALLAGLILIGGLLAMLAMVMPGIVWLLLVLGGMALIVFLQYALWGRLLERWIRVDDKEE
jgi:hypothetical protein